MSIRIALIHAVTVAVAPIEAAFRELWPEAECVNILDNSLSVDRERDGRLTAAMTGRIITLAEYGRSPGRTQSCLPARLLARRSRRRRRDCRSRC